MENRKRETIINEIEEFEHKRDTLSPKDAEEALVTILTPLLESEGYGVTYQGGIGDKGVDFLGVRAEKKIGIQYKHYSRMISGGQIYEIIGAAVVNKLDKMILLANSGFSQQARKIASEIEPVAIELLGIEDLKIWVSKIEADYDDSAVVHVLRNFTRSIIELITRNPRTLMAIEWRDVERVVAEIFSGIGFEVELTPSSKDGGKDVILECKENGTNKSYIVEIKHWRSGQRVGEKKIKEFVKVITKEKRDGGLFLSTYGYTENVVETLTEIERQKVRFGQETKIVTLCKTYMKRKSGLWHDEDDLPAILFDGTE